VKKLLEKTCPVCGGTEFRYRPVLWPELIRDWGLTGAEVEYINRREGICCAVCGCSLRVMGLAAAILGAYPQPDAPTLLAWTGSAVGQNLRVLQINTAGGWLNPDGLTDVLRRLPGHTLACFPEHDMQDLRAFADGDFRCVIHSDTMEHVPNCIAGLRECRRVLWTGGTCIYTVPLLVGKLSRGRDGMPLVRHASTVAGHPGDIVYTDYGADAWRFPLLAEFSSVTVHSFEYPAALALEARN